MLPIFYGPYYVYLTHTDDQFATNFAFCLTLSVVTSLILVGIFNVEIAMEDPFVGGGLDGIRVRECFRQMECMLHVCHETSSNGHV